FSPAPSPGSVTITQGGSSGTSTISTTVACGSARSEERRVGKGGRPAGVTASLNTTSVTAGNSSTLTLSAACGSATGTFTVTITGTEGSATQSTSASLPVNTPTTDCAFSPAPSPGSVTIIQGGSSGTSTISTTVACGSA